MRIGERRLEDRGGFVGETRHLGRGRTAAKARGRVAESDGEGAWGELLARPIGAEGSDACSAVAAHKTEKWLRLENGAGAVG